MIGNALTSTEKVACLNMIKTRFFQCFADMTTEFDQSLVTGCGRDGCSPPGKAEVKRPQSNHSAQVD